MECYVNTINDVRLDANTLYSQQLSYDEFFRTANDPAARYDAAILNDAIANIKAQMERLNASVAYPMLAERLAAGPILRSEYADFLIASGMTIDQIQYVLRVFDPLAPFDLITANYLRNLDTFYTQNFASQGTGGFCSVFTGLLNKLFSIFGAIQGLINAINELKSIEQLLHQLVETIKERLLGMLQGLIGQISQCAGSLIAASHKVRRVSEFFSDLNMQTIKDRITEIIGNIGSKFEELIQKPETIQYLIYRLCQLASAIEQFMKAPLQGIQDLLSNCMNTTNTIRYNSTARTLQAVEAGAFRLSPSAIDGTRSRVGGRLNSAAGDGGNGGGAAAATPSRYYTLPFSQNERNMANELKAASKEQIQSGAYSASSLVRFAPQVITSRYEPYPAAGIKELNVVILMILFRMARRLGTTLTVISGYRSHQFQAELYANRGNSIVAKPPGPHGRGLAVDISWPTSDFNRIIQIASQEGAGGIGTYSWGVHVDVGGDRKRSWGGYSTEALKLHKQDRFREGTPRRFGASEPPPLTGQTGAQ